MTARLSVIFSLIAAGMLMLGAEAVSAQQPQRPLFVPDEIIVMFEEDIGAAAMQTVLGVSGFQTLRELRGTGALLGALPAGADPLAVKAQLEALPQVRYAEPNYYRYIDAVPNDPRFADLWGLHNIGQTGGTFDADIDAPEGWDLAVGSRNVIVAVIDSGTDVLHPDLAANIYVNPGEVPGNGIDDDGNGFIDDVSGWDFFDNDNNVRDNSAACVGHGTHTAGTVGAVGNNGRGVTGVAQIVTILPIRSLGALGAFCVGSDADLIDGIDYATKMGAHITNASWGGPGFSNAVRDAIARSRHLFVAAAGNDGLNNDTNPFYPASYPLDNIIAVAATNHNDNRASFSNFGSSAVDLGAPGDAILSTVPNNGYAYLSGTSMATPHVVGAAAVLLGADLSLTVAELKDRLLRGTDNLGLPVVTGGRLNLNNTLRIPNAPLVVTLTPLGPTTVPRGGLLAYDVTVQNTSGSPHSVAASVRVWLPGGPEIFLVGPINITVGAGQTVQTTVSLTVPPGIATGKYFMIGRVANAVGVFDEGQLVYTIN